MKEKHFNPILQVDDDQLSVEEAGEWSLKKYRILGTYCDMFTKSMKNKYNHLVYIDLFSGKGYTRIRNHNQIVMGSPLIALSIPIPFTEYIFCEKENESLKALKNRIKKHFNGKKIKFVSGDCNLKIKEIISHIPKPSYKNKVLTFCFVDPYSFNLSLKTIRELSRFKVDFLILLAFGMDANRNLVQYLKENNERVSNFLDDLNWREKYNSLNEKDPISFRRFLAKEFKKKIEAIGFKRAEDFHEIRSIEKNLPLYHLAFFTRSDIANKFWKIAQQYSDQQQTLAFSN